MEAYGCESHIKNNIKQQHDKTKTHSVPVYWFLISHVSEIVSNLVALLAESGMLRGHGC